VAIAITVINANGGTAGLGGSLNSQISAGNFDANGLFVFQIPNTAALSPAFTIVLSNIPFFGDIDLNNDGVVDNAGGLGTISDVINVRNSAADSIVTFGSNLGGQDFSFNGGTTSFVFRDSSVGQWFGVNTSNNTQVFNANGNDVLPGGSFNNDPFTLTVGGINPAFTVAVPEPGCSLLIGLGSIVVLGLARRRK